MVLAPETQKKIAASGGLSFPLKTRNFVPKSPKTRNFDRHPPHPRGGVLLLSKANNHKELTCFKLYVLLLRIPPIISTPPPTK